MTQYRGVLCRARKEVVQEVSREGKGVGDMNPFSYANNRQPLTRKRVRFMMRMAVLHRIFSRIKKKESQ